MTLEVDLFDSLKSLVGNRVAPIIFPQPPAIPTWPAIRYSFPNNVPGATICGSGADDTADVTVQLDVVAETWAAARALRLQVMAVMDIFSPPALLELSTGTYDEETRTYREILQYSIHGSSLDAVDAELREDGGYELRE